jgi:hypothetical protein
VAEMMVVVRGGEMAILEGKGKIADMVAVGRDGEMEILEGKGKMAEMGAVVMEDLVGEKSHFRRYRVPWNSECLVFGYTGLAAFEA